MDAGTLLLSKRLITMQLHRKGTETTKTKTNSAVERTAGVTAIATVAQTSPETGTATEDSFTTPTGSFVTHTNSFASLVDTSKPFFFCFNVIHFNKKQKKFHLQLYQRLLLLP